MMKSFKQYIKEETMPYAATASGSININDPDVVDGLNAIIAGVTASKFVTPYIAYERVQKALANFLIFPPRPSFFQGNSGMYTYPINQFGDKFGQKEDGSFAKDGETLKDETHGDHPPGEPLQGTIQNTGTIAEEKYTLYFEWRQSDCGMYNIFAEVVNESDLQDILSDLEDEMNEEEDEELNEEKFTNRAPSANPYGNLDAAKKEMNKPKPVPTRKTDDLDKLNRDAEGNTVVENLGKGMKKFKFWYKGTGPQGSGDPRDVKKNLQKDPELAKKMASREGKLGGAAELQRRLAKKMVKEENLDEISAETVGKVNAARMFKPSKTSAARKTLTKAVKKKWLESDVGKIK